MAVWCRTCRAPARRTGPGMGGTGTHAGDEPEDGHPAVLTDENPVLRAQADEIQREYPGVTVSARFGFFRADWPARPGVLIAPVFGETADELREKLAAQPRLRDRK